MIYKILAKAWWCRVDDKHKFGGESWCTDDKTRVIVALKKGFFKVNGTSIRTSVRDIINQTFGKSLFIVDSPFPSTGETRSPTTLILLLS